MAFDMKITSSGEKDKIALDEEDLLKQIEEYDLDCPILAHLWEGDFYDSPVIYPKQAGQIVTELKIIEGTIRSHYSSPEPQMDWIPAIERLVKFFGAASSLESSITTYSD